MKMDWSLPSFGRAATADERVVYRPEVVVPDCTIRAPEGGDVRDAASTWTARRTSSDSDKKKVSMAIPKAEFASDFLFDSAFYSHRSEQDNLLKSPRRDIHPLICSDQYGRPAPRLTTLITPILDRILKLQQKCEYKHTGRPSALTEGLWFLEA